MQFDDTDSTSTHSDDLTAETASGTTLDLGPANYDSDGDGALDSVVMSDGTDLYVFTDHDGDGTVDSELVYDADGNIVSGSDGNDYDSGVSGSESYGGDTDPNGYGTDESGPEISFEDNGTDHTIGDATVDLDGDGVVDTAVVQGDDGTVVGFTDTDGDGQADQVTEIGPDGSVTIASQDAQGDWGVVAQGHLDADGNFVQDQSAQPEGTAGTTTGDYSTTGTASDPYGSTGQTGDISLTDSDGQSHDLGAPTVDMTGDGTPDTVLGQESDGTQVLLTDSDGDGEADVLTTIAPDGSVVMAVADGAGDWQQVASGHVDAEGNFVQDSTSGAAGATTGAASTSTYGG